MSMESLNSVMWEYWKSKAFEDAREKLSEARRLTEQVRDALEAAFGTRHLASDVIDEALDKLMLSGSRVERAQRAYDKAMPNPLGQGDGLRR